MFFYCCFFDSIFMSCFLSFFGFFYEILAVYFGYFWDHSRFLRDFSIFFKQDFFNEFLRILIEIFRGFCYFFTLIGFLHTGIPRTSFFPTIDYVRFLFDSKVLSFFLKVFWVIPKNCRSFCEFPRDFSIYCRDNSRFFCDFWFSITIFVSEFNRIFRDHSKIWNFVKLFY